ncbi:MAG: hypothetical protein M1457_04105, partial [bacterium]|nr:hypothetical protein [bacterium]
MTDQNDFTLPPRGQEPTIPESTRPETPAGAPGSGTPSGEGAAAARGSAAPPPLPPRYAAPPRRRGFLKVFLIFMGIFVFCLAGLARQ